MRAPFIASGVAALALAAWLLSPHGERGRKAPAAPPTAQHDGTDEKLAVMQQEIASLRREQAARRPDATQPAPPASDARAAANDSPEPAPRRSAEELAHGLEQHIRKERRDPAWSPKAEAAIAAAFHGDALKGSAVVRAECHTTVCRVEVSHDSEETRHDFMGTVHLVPPFTEAGFALHVDDPDTGASKTVVYIAREGQPLPSPDEG